MPKVRKLLLGIASTYRHSRCPVNLGWERPRLAFGLDGRHQQHRVKLGAHLVIGQCQRRSDEHPVSPPLRGRQQRYETLKTPSTKGCEEVIVMLNLAPLNAARGDGP